MENSHEKKQKIGVRKRVVSSQNLQELCYKETCGKWL